jgi:release factor glutamine methyltransferase
MTDTVASMIAEAAAALSKAGFDEPRRLGRRLIAGAMNISASELLMTSDHALDGSTAEKLRGLIRRMAEGEPLSRVLGSREFWGLDFELSPDTLDPRPESETIVEAVLARMDRDAPISVLDLGTGSGCLLLAILSELKMATGIGVDLSPGAVMTARRNARALGLADSSRFFVGNWGAAIAHRFDVIVANPPYIATSALGTLPAGVRRYDPRLALNGDQDGLGAYRTIASQLIELMAPRAFFITEVGIGQAAAVAAILRNRGIDVEAINPDLSGIERCLIARHGRAGHLLTPAMGEKNLGMPLHHV